MKKTPILAALVAALFAVSSACTGCHQIEALVEKTKNVKPTNPHVSPHYGNTLECVNCHMMHGESTNFCDQCHQFNFKMP